MRLRNLLSAIPLRSEASDRSEMTSQILYGESVDQLEETQKWIRVECIWDGYAGWIAKEHMLSSVESDVQRIKTSGILQCGKGSTKLISQGSMLSEEELKDFKYIGASSGSEDIDQLAQLVLSFLNTPYQWGGRSCWGIDCSGLIQVSLAMLNYAIPRDAYQQAEHGTEVSYDELEIGDLAFFQNSKGKITHVGVLLEDNKIIHASGFVRIDDLSRKGIIRTSDTVLTHELKCIKRLNI